MSQITGGYGHNFMVTKLGKVIPYNKNKMTYYDRILSKQYNHQADWKELYESTKIWKNDLMLFKQDLGFIQLVLDKYAAIRGNVNDFGIRIIPNVNLLPIYRYCYTLIEETEYQLKLLSSLISQPFGYNFKKFIKEHEYLEADISNFAKILKKTRNEVYDITACVLSYENGLHPISFHKEKLNNTDDVRMQKSVLPSKPENHFLF